MIGFLQKYWFSLLLLVLFGFAVFAMEKQPQLSSATVADVNFDSCKDNYRCYEQKLTVALHREGIKPTLKSLLELSQTNSTIQNYCHSISHSLGREAYTMLEGNIGQIFREGNTNCWSGFFHGALEKAFSHSKNLPSTAQGLCTEANGVSGNFLYYQCLHGLGHGLAAKFGNEIYQALDVCEKLKNSFEQNSCFGGVFMENYVANPEVGHASKYLDDQDPIAPCNQVKEKFKYNCYQLVSIQILKLNSYNFSEAFKTCESSDAGYIDVCYQSVGRDASGYTAENPDKALEICALGNPQAEKICVGAIASDSVYSKSSEDYVVKTCQKAKKSVKNACYEAAGSAIRVLYDASNARARACAKMEQEYVKVCEESANVT